MARIGDQEAVVRLEGVPVELFLESQDHQQDLIRELQLVQIGHQSDLATAELSHQLARLIGDILTRYAPVRSATRLQAITALDRGQEFVTLEVPIRPGMAEALSAWLAFLEEADEVCRSGVLLLTAARPEVRELRRWYAQELTKRLADSEGPAGA